MIADSAVYHIYNYIYCRNILQQHTKSDIIENVLRFGTSKYLLCRDKSQGDSKGALNTNFDPKVYVYQLLSADALDEDNSNICCSVSLYQRDIT